MPHNKRAIPRQATSATAFVHLDLDADDPLLDFTPVPHKQLRRNSITPDLQREFIAKLAETGIVTEAALHIGKSLEAIYKLRQRPGAEGFNAAWDEALRRGVERLEHCALERALAQSAFDPWGNSMLAFVLTYRQLQQQYEYEIEPGHKVYERIRREVLEELRRTDDLRGGDGTGGDGVCGD